MTYPMPTTDPTNIGNPPGSGPLRAGGVSQSTDLGPTAEANLPSTMCPVARQQMPDLELVRDCWAGNTRIHDKSTTYLPQNPGEDPQNYRVRLQRAVFFNVFRNTIEGLVGYVFRADPKLGDDVPAPIVALWENIDNAGTHGDVWLRERMTDSMTAGHGAIFVEYPKTDGQQTAGQEQRGEARPYWLPVLKENMLNWRTVVEDGRTLLRQLVLRECTWVEEGEFGMKEQTRYRVLYRERTAAGVEVGFRLLEINDRKQVVEVGRGDYPTLKEIPVAEIRTAGSKSLFESDPPFLDLAYLNLAHYRQWSDYDTSIHKTCVPIYWEAGVDMTEVPQDGSPAPKLILGPSSARRSTNPAFKVGYASHDGAALGSCKASLDDLKQDMAALGLAALASQKRVAETAQAKELDKGATDSALAVNARGLADATERALQFTAQLMGLPSGGSIEINRDYGEQGMDAAKMMAWATLAEKLGVPVRFVLERLMDAGEIPEGTDLDQLEDEMLAIQLQKEEQAQRDAQALAAQKAQGMAA